MEELANERAERAVIGAIIVDGECFSRVSNTLFGKDFWYPRNKVIFEAIVELSRNNVSIDLVTVVDQLVRLGKNEEAGGLSYVSGIADELPDPASVEHYAGIVKDLSIRRRVVAAAKRLELMARKMDDRIEASADLAVGELLDACGPVMSNDAGNASEIIDEVLAESEARKKSGKHSIGIPIGIPPIDRIFKGLCNEDLIVIGAGTSVGKTSLGLQIAGNLARAGYRPLYFSLEMSKKQIATRLLSQLSGVSGDVIEGWQFTRDELDSAIKVRDDLATNDVRIDASAELWVSSLLSRALAQKRTTGLDVIVVDYLQLMVTSGKSDNRANEVSQLTRGLKMAAKKLGIPIIALSQLSRTYDGRLATWKPSADPNDIGPLPKKSDLRESGSIEQDADAILLLHRLTDPEYPEEKRRRVKLVIAKQRTGRQGDVVNLYWRPDTQTVHGVFAIDNVPRDEGR